MKLTNTKFTNTRLSNWKRIASPLLLTVVAGIALAVGTAQAQGLGLTPEEQQHFEERFRNLPPEQRQQIEERLRNMPPEQIQQMIERYRSMTPEQRQQLEERFMRQAQGGGRGEGRAGWGGGRGEGGGDDWRQNVEISPEDRQKYLMRSAGIEDVAVQNAVIAFVAEQAKQRQGVTEAATGLSALLADKSASPAAISAAQENLIAASKAFRDWKQTALAALDTRISYSQNPRLKSLLILVGIIGDEASDAGGFNAIFPKGVAGSGDIMDFVPRAGRGGRGGRGGWNRQPGAPPGPEG